MNGAECKAKVGLQVMAARLLYLTLFIVGELMIKIRPLYLTKKSSAEIDNAWDKADIS